MVADRHFRDAVLCNIHAPLIRDQLTSSYRSYLVQLHIITGEIITVYYVIGYISLLYYHRIFYDIMDNGPIGTE